MSFLNLTLFHGLNRPSRLGITVITHLYSPVKKKIWKNFVSVLDGGLGGRYFAPGPISTTWAKKNSQMQIWPSSEWRTKKSIKKAQLGLQKGQLSRLPLSNKEKLQAQGQIKPLSKNYFLIRIVSGVVRQYTRFVHVWDLW